MHRSALILDPRFSLNAQVGSKAPAWRALGSGALDPTCYFGGEEGRPWPRNAEEVALLSSPDQQEDAHGGEVKPPSVRKRRRCPLPKHLRLNWPVFMPSPPRENGPRRS
jgi:hypothetical protein